MTDRPIQRISDALARRVATYCSDVLKRATTRRPTFAASHPVNDFERAYDTIVLKFEPPQPRLERALLRLPFAVLSQSPSKPAQPPAQLVREALLLLHELSCCPGYAFHENFVFWNATVAQANPPTGALPPKNGVRFPRVLLDWNPRYDWVQTRDVDYAASLRMFETGVLALFATPSTHPLSRDGQKLMASLRQFRASSTERARPIQCIVSIPFARGAKDTKALVDSVISSATTLASKTTEQSRTQSEFAWVGVRLSGCRGITYMHRGLVTLANLKILRRLCVSLPPRIAFNFTLPRADPHGRRPPNEVPREPMVAFLMLAIGVSNTELLGRLTMLDLTHVANTTVVTLDFASLCTVLPLSRSLQKLCVTAESKLDLLWLAYAATHPFTPTTQWRSLHLSNYAAEWPQLDRLVASSSLLAELWTETTHRFSPSTTTTNVRTPPGHYVRRTAKIAQDVPFFSPDKTRIFVQLVRGQNVELCDSTTPLDKLVLETGNPDLDDVAVVVAGVGLGWVYKRHLTQLTEASHDSSLRSYITTLHLAFHNGHQTDMQSILSFFGPTLTHLSAYRASRIAIDDMARTCPRLKTLELAVLREVEDHETNELPVMSHLRYVGLVCSDVTSLGRTLHRLHSFACLDMVRIQLDWNVRVDDTGWGVIEDHVSALVAARARTLRFLTITHTLAVAARASCDDRLSCDASSKLALLSVLHHARDDAGESRSAVARVGSDVERLVFDFAGPSLKRRVVEAYDLWPSDWYESHSSY